MINTFKALSLTGVLIALVAGVGISQTNAPGPQEKILFVELSVPRGNGTPLVDRLTVPNGFDFEKSFVGHVMATVDCIVCRLESSFYFGVSEAKRMKGDRTTVGIEVKFENAPECNSSRKVTMKDKEKKEITLKCGVKATAYYASPPQK
jgi:hypothetical protein